MTMVRLDLTPNDVTSLIKVLEYYVSELRMEVADTERKEMRDALRGEEKTLEKILADLRSSTDPA